MTAVTVMPVRVIEGETTVTLRQSLAVKDGVGTGDVLERLEGREVTEPADATISNSPRNPVLRLDACHQGTLGQLTITCLRTHRFESPTKNGPHPDGKVGLVG